MPPKKRQPETTIDEAASEEYKKKLRLRKPKSRPKLSPQECKQYTVKAPYPQSYPYPPAIITYIARNPPNLDGHRNLIKSAKSLLRMSRILPVENVKNCRDDENIFEADYHRFRLTDKSFDMWITSYFTIGKFSPRAVLNPYFASTLLKRIYRCTARMMHLHGQILTFEELKFLFSADELQHVVLIDNIFKNGIDGSVEKFENVFEILLKADHMGITFPSEQNGIRNDTARKMVEMLENEKVRHSIHLKNIPEKFHFSTFAIFFKTNLTGNQRISHGIDLSFSTAISQTFKNQLQTFFHEILALVEHHNITSRSVPLIKFVGQDEVVFGKLQERRQRRLQLATMPARRAPRR